MLLVARRVCECSNTAHKCWNSATATGNIAGQNQDRHTDYNSHAKVILHGTFKTLFSSKVLVFFSLSEGGMSDRKQYLHPFMTSQSSQKSHSLNCVKQTFSVSGKFTSWTETHIIVRK